MERLLIRGGRLIDPGNGIDGVRDLAIAEGRIVAVGQPPAGFTPERVIDARSQIVCPGLIDLSARLREPGAEYKAEIVTETRAAAARGITTLVVPPDTEPVIDETAVVELIRRRAEAAGGARVLMLGALTRGLAGEQLAGMAALKSAGCIGVSNAARPIVNTAVLRRALEYAATYEMTVFLDPVDHWLAADGCAHDGEVATRLGLPGIPTAAETAILARDLALIEDIGVRVHFCRLSSARSVAMIA
ncbi:MAG: dihydroorotase, partial [Gammaproteobacteria bacterium]